MENINNFTSELIYDLKTFKKVCLFVHVTPDCDAIGSAYAMFNFIKLNFPNTKVRIAGMSKLNTNYLPEFFRQNYKPVDEKYSENSLGIVFDTANHERIYDKQFFNCKKSYRIDHHILLSKICDVEYIDQNASSTCEMLGIVFEKSKLPINSTIANSLYFGLLTDTIRFLTNNVNENTYKVMSYLQSNNLLDRKLVQDQLYLKRLDDVKLERKLFKYIHFKKEYAYMLFNKKITQKYGSNNLKNKLFLMSGIKEIKIYILIYFDTNVNMYKGSIRSRDYNVNLIARKFSGGGHMYASGFKLKDKKEIKKLKYEVKKLLKLNNKYE